MGRKIPGKKHRGIKDPLQQLAKRNEELKNKINAAPANPDHQEVPKSLLEVSRLIQMVKDGKYDKKKRKKNNKVNVVDTGNLGSAGPKLPGMLQHDKSLPRLTLKYGETEEHFIQRVDSATEDLINEAKMEKQFNVIVQRNKSGKVKQIHMGQAKDEKKQKKNFKSNDKDSSESKKVNRLSSRKRKKLKKAAHSEEKLEDKIEKQYEKVRFGEIVHAPPQLQKRPRGADSSISSKPGAKQLLLSSVLGNPKKNKEILSMSMKQKIDKRREDVVAAYREMKAQKRNRS